MSDQPIGDVVTNPTIVPFGAALLTEYSPLLGEYDPAARKTTYSTGSESGE